MFNRFVFVNFGDTSNYKNCESEYSIHADSLMRIIQNIFFEPLNYWYQPM